MLVAGVFLAFAVGSAPMAVLAQTGDLFEGLAAQPVTLMDAGIKRMRAGAQTAAARLTTAVGPPAQYRVTFDNALRHLNVRFDVTVAPDKTSEGFCWARRGIAIREMFGVGAIRYSLKLSDEERVRRRLGVMFSREPEATEREIVALGQRLAESTYVELNLLTPASETPMTCRAVVHRLEWR
ncbi:MAG TPA: hypothetical protein DC046_00775 [Rhodospirillaceae bacterium]|nr:hypothetical protein [Rhodospirillaceae bacterium]